MKNLAIGILLILCSLRLEANCTLSADLTGPVGAGTHDFISRALESAIEKKCTSILLNINTPGGNLQSTRMIVETILNSPLPFLCVVAPSGAHAGSAGAIILQACHVAGALEATNIGAATPIVGTGEDMKGDLKNKMINDTVSWLEGLTKLRGRNQKFGRDIVESAKAVDSSEAFKIGAIDIVAKSVDEFLSKANSREVKLAAGAVTTVSVGTMVRFERDSRVDFLDFLANPQIAYLLFMGSLALLYFEITHPGTMVPGVLGGLGLILSLVSFHILDVSWGGLLLMIVGLALLVAEAFLPSFGILGVGGIAAFIFGGLLLFDAETAGFSLRLALVLPTAIGVGGLMMLLGYYVAKVLKAKSKTGQESLIGETATVSYLNADSRSGQCHLHGETWSFDSQHELKLQDQVIVKKIEGLKLFVEKRNH